MPIRCQYYITIHFDSKAWYTMQGIFFMLKTFYSIFLLFLFVRGPQMQLTGSNHRKKMTNIYNDSYLKEKYHSQYPGNF